VASVLANWPPWQPGGVQADEWLARPEKQIRETPAFNWQEKVRQRYLLEEARSLLKPGHP
jgi:hypothetical protein